jgi:signal peptidase II
LKQGRGVQAIWKAEGKMSLINIFRQRIKYIAMTAGIFCINYLLDRVTKIIAVKYLDKHNPIVLLNNIIVLILAENNGAFLSMGKNWNIYIKYFALLIIPIIICVYGLFYLMFKETKNYRIILISCIIGGGIGNLIDRLLNGFKVIDFMNFGFGNIRTGILNTADLSVTFGAIILIIYEAIRNKK